MFFFSKARRLAFLSPLAAAAAMAQPAAVPATTPAAESAPPAYRSALEGYQPFSEEKTASWPAANDTVGRIGGWRAYAKEAQAPDAATQAPPPAAGPAQPSAGHGKHH